MLLLLTLMHLCLYRRDRSCLENRRKGGDASLPDEPDVLEQQPHWSGNRGIDYHQLREGSGGGYQNQRKGDAFLPPSKYVDPIVMNYNIYIHLHCCYSHN